MAAMRRRNGDAGGLRATRGKQPRQALKDLLPGSPAVALTPQMRGNYPGYDVLAQADHWDEVTRKLVLGRVQNVPEIRFFDAAQAATLGAFCDIVMAQDREPRVPVLAMVDQRFAEGRLDGFRYADMPDDGETWRLAARALDGSVARAEYDPEIAQPAPGAFAAAPVKEQMRVVGSLASGAVPGGAWDALPPARAWKVLTRYILAAFYSHPWAWSEIGFGGPAYPRGYARLAAGQRDHWEKPERREPGQPDLPSSSEA